MALGLRIDPLFRGLTAPPMMFGVPVVFMGFNGMLGLMGLVWITSLLHKALFLLVVCGGLHGLARLKTKRDEHWIGVLLTKWQKTAPAITSRRWGCNSYRP